MIHSETAEPDSVRRLGFTFTARDRPTAQALDPASPAAALTPRAPGSAPPAIAVRQL